MVNIVHVFTISYVSYDIKQVCERELVNNISQSIFMRLVLYHIPNAEAAAGVLGLAFQWFLYYVF